MPMYMGMLMYAPTDKLTLMGLVVLSSALWGGACYSMTKVMANETCTEPCRPPGSFSSLGWRYRDLRMAALSRRHDYGPIQEHTR